MAFDRYLLTYACPNGTCPNTMHAVGIGSANNHSLAQLLVRWFLYIAQAVTAVTLPAFEYRRCIAQDTFSRAATYFFDDDAIAPPMFWETPEPDELHSGAVSSSDSENDDR